MPSTLSTVGFGETLEGMDGVPLARVWTLGLILVGSGTLGQQLNRKLEQVKDHVRLRRVGDRTARDLHFAWNGRNTCLSGCRGSHRSVVARCRDDARLQIVRGAPAVRCMRSRRDIR